MQERCAIRRESMSAGPWKQSLAFRSLKRRLRVDQRHSDNAVFERLVGIQ